MKENFDAALKAILHHEGNYSAVVFLRVSFKTICLA